MKKLPIALIVLLVGILTLQTGCSPSNDIDWEQIIQTDFLSGESTVEQALAKSISFKVKQNGQQLTVTVKGPNICDGLLDWLESVSNESFTETAMEQEILRLLKDSKKTTSDYILNCSEGENGTKVAYSTEFGEAMTCGLSRFYAEVTQQILGEIGGNAE